MHHLPDRGTPEWEALIREIKADPVAYTDRLLKRMGTPEVDALLASLSRTAGLNEKDPYGQ